MRAQEDPAPPAGRRNQPTGAPVLAQLAEQARAHLATVARHRR